MKAKKIGAIICGLLIVIVDAIMIIRTGVNANNHCMHPEWSIGVIDVVNITGFLYSIIIVICTIILVLMVVLSKNDK